MLKELNELLKEHTYVFLDETFVDVDDIEEEINYMREYCFDSDSMVVPISSVKPMAKPIFTFDDLGEKLEAHSYDTENAQGTELLDENKETLDKINELVHSIILPIYTSDKTLFNILIYADEEKGFEIILEEGK